ncbi:MAG: hypothetical protein Q9Q40_13250 [Acidobacteriota bacterium]|nr:hypothetical protein [Acidobacteriota bacterium]MDQ7088541.1 hypothetical protein [Acidobacteriota bacterium]
MAKSNSSRPQVLLLILLLLVVFFIWKTGVFAPRQAGAEKSAAELSLGERLDALANLPPVLVDRPTTSADYAGSRNIFDYSTNPEVLRERRLQQLAREAARKKQQERQKELVQQRQRQAALNPRPPAPPRAAPPPDFRYQYVAYIGRFTEPMEFLAVLTRAGASKDIKRADIRTVRVGEIIDNKFVVKKIDIDSMTIGYTDPKFREKTKTVKLVLPKGPASKGRRG